MFARASEGGQGGGLETGSLNARIEVTIRAVDRGQTTRLRAINGERLGAQRRVLETGFAI